MDSIPIVLTTDFGASSPAVGVMKGVILTINPQANIFDLTHQVSPQNVLQGARILGDSHVYFPRSAIHVAVVDPGVGTSRQALLVTTRHGRFVGPDNGIFSSVILEYLSESPSADGSVAIPPGCSARTLTQAKYWLDPVSNTFHGRDIFSPVAAHLSLGLPDSDVGPVVDQIRFLASPQPSTESSSQGNTIHGEVVHADHFGNLITNITAKDLTQAAKVTVQIRGHKIPGLSTTFHGDVPPVDGDLVALISSSGYLEIAVTDGSAAHYLDSGPGEAVYIHTIHAPDSHSPES